MSLPAPYPHQVRAREGVVAAYRAGARNIGLVLPTGAGKTYCATDICRGAMAKGRRALTLAHTEELVDQMAESLRRLGQRVGVVKAGRPSDPTAPMQVASVQTLVARPECMPPADILIADEVHHYVARTYQAVLGRYPSLELLLGLTATPQRADGKPLGTSAGGVLQTLVVPTSVAELQRTLRPDGHPILVPCRVIGPAAPQTELWREPLEGLRQFGCRADGTLRPTILFFATVEEARACARAAVARGMRAACVDGKTDEAERREAVEAYASGRLDLLTNVMVLTEGFDAVRTEVVGVARGCTAESTWLQMIGRGLRSSPATGKRDCLLIDYRGLTWKHGLAEDARSYSLDGKAISRTELDPITQCAGCGGVFRRAETMRGCPRCGVTLPARPRKATKVRETETVEISAARVSATRAQQVEALRRMLGEAHAKGWKPTAAPMRFKDRFGYWPSKALMSAARGAA